MPPRLTKPTNVPKSRVRLVDALWRFYVAADRPPTRRIAEAIEALPEKQRTGTANHETVRRTLRGEAVGSLQTVEVIFLALCELADVDPDDAEPDDDDRWHVSMPHSEEIRRAWHEAVDGAPMPAIPRTRAQKDADDAARRAEQEAERERQAAFTQRYGGGAGNFDDEPPF